MPLKAVDDKGFVDLAIHQIERMFRPGFGGKKFFNRELFDYVLELAATDVEQLHREVHAFAHDLGHSGWDVQVRADNSQPNPTVYIKVITPTSTAEVVIHKTGLDILRD